jgi:hypothetical protein
MFNVQDLNSGWKEQVMHPLVARIPRVELSLNFFVNAVLTG